MRNIVENDYFNWLYGLVCDDMANVTYRDLLYYLYNVEFVYCLEMDGNRASDGKNFRYRFGYDRHYTTSEIDGYLGYLPCNVLEMMIALSFDIEEHVMDDPSCGDRTGQWFWNMIASLGLLGMSDGRFDMYEAGAKIDAFLERRYKRNGEGGLFTIRNRSLDMRDMEIWHQAMCYLDENYDFTL